LTYAPNDHRTTVEQKSPPVSLAGFAEIGPSRALSHPRPRSQDCCGCSSD